MRTSALHRVDFGLAIGYKQTIMITTTLRRLLGPLVVGSLLLGCQMPAQRAGMPPFGSLAQITAITPDTTRVLRTGERVRLQVDVGHVLTAESGTLRLIVLAEDNSEVAQDSRQITKGSGSSRLHAEFTVPSTTAIRVYTPLLIQEQGATFSADGRAFQVVAP